MTPYYERDGITIYCGDCRKVLPIIDLSAVNVTLTDPPYNVGLDYSDGDNRPDYDDWCRSWFELLPRPIALTPGTVNLAMWLVIEKPRWTVAWVKPNQCSPSALNGFNAWEPILIYGKHRKPIGQDVITTNIRLNQLYVGDHPCPKDLPGWTKVLSAVSLDGDTVLDPFLGSGTTAMAARNLGRKLISVELEERYCEIAVKRLQQSVMNLEVA